MSFFPVGCFLEDLMGNSHSEILLFPFHLFQLTVLLVLVPYSLLGDGSCFKLIKC